MPCFVTRTLISDSDFSEGCVLLLFAKFWNRCETSKRVYCTMRYSPTWHGDSHMGTLGCPFVGNSSRKFSRGIVLLGTDAHSRVSKESTMNKLAVPGKEDYAYLARPIFSGISTYMHAHMPILTPV